VARVGVQVAEALAYASSQGILHRDIKPSNLLLDTQGTVWIADFGLAKAADSKDLTHTGDIVGTMRYLAPERFEGQADTRSDIYALGLTVFELLTLRPAFDENDQNKLMAQVMQAEPPRPRQLCPEVPRDLETIVLKAIDRDPSRRYQTATELAEDLKRYVAGEPIRARRVTAWQRTILWAKRKPAQAAMLLASGVAALALVGVGVAMIYNAKLQKSVRETEAALDQAHLARANAGWLSENMTHVEMLLDSCAADRRAWEWKYLKRLCHADLLTLKGHSGKVWGMAFSLDGSRLASASGDGTVKLWNSATGQVAHTLVGHLGQAHCVAFSPDGTRLASGGQDDGTVRIWDATTGNLVYTLEDRDKSVFSVSFSPDGNRLASACMGGAVVNAVKIWDMATGRKIDTLTGHGNAVHGVAFSPDGTRLASASRDRIAMIWDARTGKRLQTLKGHTGLLTGVAFSPDGTRLVTSSADRTVKVWDAASGQVVLTFSGHGSTVHSVTFSPDGSWIASASADGAVKVWDATNGRLAFTHLGHPSGIWGVAFSPDGTRLATASSDQTVKVWDATTGPELRIFTGSSGLLSVAFGPDGTRLGRPVVLAFLAMAQHRLALRDQAQATLQHLQQVMQQAEWAMNAEARAFVREAETVLAAAPVTRNEGI
jgi:WD40 repeat protein